MTGLWWQRGYGRRKVSVLRLELRDFRAKRIVECVFPLLEAQGKGKQIRVDLAKCCWAKTWRNEQVFILLKKNGAFP